MISLGGLKDREGETVDYVQQPAVSIYHRRRQRRAAITLVLVSLMMLGTFAYAAAYFQGWVGNQASNAAGSSECQQVTRAQASKAGTVTINVYNATDRQGLAASVAKSLRTQGFKVAVVANDPLGKQIAGVGEVRRGRSGAAGAALVATRLSGAKVVPDKRADATVDLVLGNRFTALRAPSAAIPGAPPKVISANVTKPSPSRSIAPLGSC